MTGFTTNAVYQVASRRVGASNFTLPACIRDAGKVRLGAEDLGAAVAGITDTLLNNFAATTVNTSGTTSSSQMQSTSSNTNVSGSDVTNTNTDTKTNNTVTNSADPGVITMLKNLAQTAISNSTDPTKVTGLISGIIQNAGDAMTAIFGQQKQSGLYDSSAAQSQNNDIISRATADAASAVLGYQTSEQQLGASIGGQLLGATATQTTQGDVQTTGQTVDNSSIQTAVSGQSTNHTEAVVQQSQSTAKSESIVCTWMYEHGLLEKRKYLVSAGQLQKLPRLRVDAYHSVARPLVKELKRNQESLVSLATRKVFYHRTEYVCGVARMRGAKKTFLGFLSFWLVETVVGSCIPYHWLAEKVDRKLVEIGVE